MSELKNCPFCGKIPQIHYNINYNTGKKESFYVCCSCQSFVDYETEQEVIEAWNKRVVPEGCVKLNEVLKNIGHDILHVSYMSDRHDKTHGLDKPNQYSYALKILKGLNYNIKSLESKTTTEVDKPTLAEKGSE